MEFAKFLKLVKRNKYGLSIIPVLMMVMTFFLVRKNPDVYFSKSRLSAGITNEATNESQQATLNKETAQENTVNQEFTNLLQTMQLKLVFDQVSYQLILHDLTSDEPFRKPSKLLKQVNDDAKKHAIQVYARMYANRQPLSMTDPDQKGLAQVLGSMHYDEGSLRDKIRVYRVENSDFIDISCESEDPLLSAFVVNTYCREFINYYSTISNANEVSAIKFLSDLLTQKKDSLDKKTEELKEYKIRNGVLSLSEQAKSLYSRIADFSTRLEVAQKEIDANTGAIAEINSKFNPNDPGYLESKMVLGNREIVLLREQLNNLNDEYIRNNLNSEIKGKIDSTRQVLNEKIAATTDRYVMNPMASKQNLVNEKLRLEIELDLAKNSIRSYKNVIGALQSKLDLLVPTEAVIQSYEAAIGVASQEYEELLKKFNQANMDFNSSSRVKQIEVAFPGSKSPSKKIILVAMAGVVSAVLYMLVLFIVFYFDESIQDTNDLFKKTDMRVLGFLPVIKSSFLDIQKLWSLDESNSEIKKLVRTARTDIQRLKSGITPANPANTEFKRQIRAARFEINMALTGGRNLVITSLNGEEGKTLVALSLVSAYQMTNKKILLIDGNFIHSSISEITNPKFFIEDYLLGRVTIDQLKPDGNITVLGNYGHDVSLFEIGSEFEVEQRMLELKDAFDIIIIEASALDTLNQSKEWIVVADRVMCVFEANSTISHEKKRQIQYLGGLQGKFIGWMLNKVTDHDDSSKRK